LNIKIYNIKYVYVHVETIVSPNVLIYDYIIIKSWLQITSFSHK